MRIVIFSTAYLPFLGGAELAVKEITERLLDYSFLCLTYKFDKEWHTREKIGNINIIRVGGGIVNLKPKTYNLKADKYYGHYFKKIIYVFKLWLEAERQHRLTPFDGIWAVMASYAGLAALFFKFCHPKVPFLLTLQEGDSEKHILRRVGIFYPLWRLIFKKADYIQAISNYLADFARRHGAKCSIKVVPNGVSISRYTQIESASQNTQIHADVQHRSAYAEGQDQRVSASIIITTSRLVYKNGVDILIRAAAELKKFYASEFIIKVLGSGPDEKKLKRLAKDLNIDNQVEFLDQVDFAEIPDYLSRADIFVRPSRSEGLGISFLEAMAAGLPIIGTCVGGIPDFLKDGETGLFVKSEDPKDLAEKIKQLLTDSKLSEKIAQNGQKLILENYSWDLIAEKMDKIFRNLCVS